MERANLVTFEHQYCLFLRFSIIIELGDGAVWLKMAGPEGAKDFLSSIFD